MKKLFMAFAFALIASGAMAQSGKAKSKAEPQPVVKESMVDQVVTNDCYTRMGGNMMIIQAGETRPLENDQIQFENGNYLTRDGILVFNNGTEKVYLEEGMKVDMNGNVIRQEKAAPVKVD